MVRERDERAREKEKQSLEREGERERKSPRYIRSSKQKFSCCREQYLFLRVNFFILLSIFIPHRLSDIISDFINFFSS